MTDSQIVEWARSTLLPATLALAKVHLPTGRNPEFSLHGGASGFGIKLNGQKCLVTCHHVWEDYEKYLAESDQHVIGGYAPSSAAANVLVPFALEGLRCVLECKELDLAILEFDEFWDLGGGSAHPVFINPTFTMEPPKVGEVLVTVGYPGAGRAAQNLDHAAFVLRVTAVHDNDIFLSPSPDRQSSGSSQMLTPESYLGGMSGSPVHVWDEELPAFRLCGIFRAGANATGPLRCKSLRALTREGKIDTGYLPGLFAPQPSEESHDAMKNYLDEN